MRWKPPFRLRTAALALVAVLLAAGVVLRAWLPYAVRGVVQEKLDERIATAVVVGGIDLSVLRGSVRLRDITVANPEGFGDGPMVTVEEAFLDVGWLALLGGTARIDTARLRGVRGDFERRGDGRVNWREALSIPPPVAGPPQGTRPTANDPPAPRARAERRSNRPRAFAIGRLEIEDIALRATNHDPERYTGTAGVSLRQARLTGLAWPPPGEGDSSRAKARISGLRLTGPAGFPTRDLLAVEELRATARFASNDGRPSAEVTRLDIEGPRLVNATGLDDRSNWRKASRIVFRYVFGDGGDDEAPAPAPPPSTDPPPGDAPGNGPVAEAGTATPPPGEDPPGRRRGWGGLGGGFRIDEINVTGGSWAIHWIGAGGEWRDESFDDFVMAAKNLAERPDEGPVALSARARTLGGDGTLALSLSGRGLIDAEAADPAGEFLLEFDGFPFHAFVAGKADDEERVFNALADGRFHGSRTAGGLDGDFQVIFRDIDVSPARRGLLARLRDGGDFFGGMRETRWPRLLRDLRAPGTDASPPITGELAIPNEEYNLFGAYFRYLLAFQEARGEVLSRSVAPGS